MPNNRDEYEPIIATRPRREPVEEETQPVWRLALTLGGGLVVVVLIAWWFMGRSSNEVASTPVETEEVAPEVIEQQPAPPATDAEPSAEIAQAPAPPATPPATSTEPAASAEQAAPTENAPTPTPTPDTAEPRPVPPPPSPPALVSLRLSSPDTQVQFEVRGSGDAAPVTGKAGGVVELAPGTYRVVASGDRLETIERELVLTGQSPAQFTVELCAQPKQELESLVGQVVEERACATTAQCESMFNVLSEHAEQLVNDRGFRTQQCAKWRAEAAPDGRWTLDTKCDGATLATTCRIEIAQGACAVTEPRRSVRGGACPQAALE